MIPSIPYSAPAEPSNGPALHSVRNIGAKVRVPPPLGFEPHTGELYCNCPQCKLYSYIGFLYQNQRRSSPHILRARPSPFLTGPLPDLSPVGPPPGVDVCPVMKAFGFCPMNRGCYLSHNIPQKGSTITQKLKSAEEEFDRLVGKTVCNQENGLWSCGVCGFTGIDEYQVGPVGETFYYRNCPRCSFFCYEPNISYLVDFVLQDVGDDYLLYKDSVDSYRRRLPDEFKVPFTYEANRVGTTVFAWSLLSPEEAKYAVETACRVLPTADQIMSIGSGGGYVEHVFNRVLHNVVLDPQWEVNRKTFPKSYFDNVKADIGGRQLPIFAFDELALKNTYSVHVSIGDPLALLSATRNTILLLCWPPFGSPTEEQSSMAFEALEYFTQRGGEVVIYVGDVASTGDWRFHELLRDQYKLVKGYPVRHEVRRWYPQEMGLIYAGNDTVGVYQRRGYL